MNKYEIVRVPFSGAATIVTNRTSETMPPAWFALDSDGNLWTIDETVVSSNVWALYKVTSPGQVGETKTLYHTFTQGMYDVTYDAWCTWQSMKIYGNNLYLLYRNESEYSTYQLFKFTDITQDTASMSIIDTTIAIGISELYVKSDTEFYFTVLDGIGRNVTKLSYSSSTWSTETVIPTHDYVGNYTSHGSFDLDIHPIKINTLGKIYLSGVVEDSADVAKIYNADFTELDTVAVTGIDDTIGISYYLGDTASEYTFIVCGYNSDDVYKCYPTDYYKLIASDSTMAGTIIHIVSNLTDLGAANEKRICRAYLPVEAENAALGEMALEPDYAVNSTIHVNSESAEPTGATSLQSFSHAGRKTWSYTNSIFDSQVEQWDDVRIDIGTKGKAFRYAIRCGDMGVANPGTLRIKPPYLDAQILTKQ